MRTINRKQLYHPSTQLSARSFFYTFYTVPHGENSPSLITIFLTAFLLRAFLSTNNVLMIVFIYSPPPPDTVFATSGFAFVISCGG